MNLEKSLEKSVRSAVMPLARRMVQLERALRKVQIVLAANRDGELPSNFTWEEFKYLIVDPAMENNELPESQRSHYDDITLDTIIKEYQSQ